MRSPTEFLIVAVLVCLTPGPATAMVVRTAAVRGRGQALAAVAGHSVGVLGWALLSATGAASLIVASRIGYDALRIAGAAYLVLLGLRSLLGHGGDGEAGGRVAGWRTGLLTSAANPKLALFFLALFPQFLARGAAVLPAAVLMALVIVACDVVWFSTLAWLVDRAGRALRPRLRRLLDRVSGAVLVGLGVRVAVAAR
jgi:threonine/homoserine/homoserine lactone efflux protein